MARRPLFWGPVAGREPCWLGPGPRPSIRGHSRGVDVRKHRSASPTIDHTTAGCPECDAVVRLIGVRWLAAHEPGGVKAAYPRAVNRRCPGSLLAVHPPAPRSA
jgi:hypothetical protein